MALLHKNSLPCSIQQLDLFEPLVTCNQVVKSQSVPHYPINGSNPTTNILEFMVPGSGDQYIDLYNTRLHLKCKIIKGDGTDYKQGAGQTDQYAKFCNVSNPIATIFQQCDVMLNDKLITGSNNLYPYRAYIDMLTNYRKDTLSSTASSQLFYMDDANEHNNIAGNTGAQSRMAFAQNSRIFEIEGPLFTDITSQGRYLLNNVDIRVRLSRSDDQFCLMEVLTLITAATPGNPGVISTVTKPQLHIEEAILKIQKVTLNPNAQLAIEHNLRNNNVIYNIMREEP